MKQRFHFYAPEADPDRDLWSFFGDAVPKDYHDTRDPLLDVHDTALGAYKLDVRHEWCVSHVRRVRGE